MLVNQSNLYMKSILTLLLIFTFKSLIAQKSPTLFEPGKISDGGAFGLTISPDGKTALWVASQGKRDTLKIMESRFDGGQWSEPKLANFSTSNGAWKDIDPMFSPNGKKVLFQTNRNTYRSEKREDFDIWAVDLTKDGWGEAYPLAGAINSEASESYASMTKDGTIYFMKENPDGTGSSDIYYSKLINGKYQEAQNLGSPINTNERESNPYIAPNGKYILYFSTDKNGFGQVDLYISFYKKKAWTIPVNLGPSINTAIAEFCPFVHQKQRKLYFSRQEKLEERFIENVYCVDFDLSSFVDK